MRKTKIATLGALAAAFIAVPAAPAFAYDVQPGDTLSDIAQQHGTTWQDLASHNRLHDPDRIFPGQDIALPGRHSEDDAAPTTDDAAPTTRPVPRPSTAASPPSGQVPQGGAAAPEQASAPEQPAGDTSASPSARSAKAEIIRRESSGNPRARNGKYHGLFQTDQPWGRGSVAEQHAGAERYVRERYGSWPAALRFHDRNGWY